MGNKQSNTTQNTNALYKEYQSNNFNYEKSYNDMLKDKGDYYIGSALRYVPRKRPEVDGDFLRKQMPNRHLPKKTNILDFLEEKVVNYMEQKAKEDKYSCEYTISTLIPGFPPIYDKDEVMDELIERLNKRESVTAVPSKKMPHTLLITWVKLTLPSQVKQ